MATTCGHIVMVVSYIDPKRGAPLYSWPKKRKTHPSYIRFSCDVIVIFSSIFLECWDKTAGFFLLLLLYSLPYIDSILH
jgi:hypothetical protein